ncbi:hypothetical protein MMC07_004852 [Pseudocyphellaria aurata]|nr:hypothetical protein [Pseudocyphellaria aurata]
MTFTAPAPHGNQAIQYEPCDLLDPSTGRLWPYEAIDHFIIGRIHGEYDWWQTWIHSMIFDDFDSTTKAELRGFWMNTLSNSKIRLWWSLQDPNDPAVKQVLDEIDVVLNDPDQLFRT